LQGYIAPSAFASGYSATGTKLKIVFDCDLQRCRAKRRFRAAAGSALFLDAAQAVDAALADEQNRETNPVPSVLR
jgi:hypothetical protein